MASVIIDDTNLKNIADAIREKNGTDETYVPSAMADAIKAIETGSKIVYGTYTGSKDNTTQVVSHGLGCKPKMIYLYVDGFDTPPTSSTTSFAGYNQFTEANYNTETETGSSTYCYISSFGYYSGSSSTTRFYKAQYTWYKNQSVTTKADANISDVTETTFTTPKFTRAGITYRYFAIG